MEQRGRGSSQSRNQQSLHQQSLPKGKPKTAQERANAEGEQRMTRRQETTALAKPEQLAPFFSLVENDKVAGMIQSLAKDTLLKPDRLIYIARAGLSRNKPLLECTPMSWVGALMDCAQLGLEPIGALGHFYFVPYRNNQIRDANNKGIMEVQGQIGYIGIMELARRSGEIGYVRMESVFEGDVLEVNEGAGTTTDGQRVANYFIHRPDYARRTNRIIAAWAKAYFKDPGIDVFKVIDAIEIKKHRDMSRSASGRKPELSPWSKWEPQMAAKTAVRCMRPSIPQSPTGKPESMFGKALAVDEAIDLGLTQASRWRDLGEKSEVIDQFLGEFKPEQGEQIQVPAQIEEGKPDPKPKGSDEPPPADEPPGDMADKLETDKKEAKKAKKKEAKKAKKKEEKAAEPTVDAPPDKANRTAKQIVNAFQRNYKVSLEDLEKTAAAVDEPPVLMADWDDQTLVFFEGVLEQLRDAADEKAMKSILYQWLRLEGSLG